MLLGTVSKNYPGGNIEFLKREGNAIYLKQEIRDSGEWWFYWNFCAEGFEGEEIEFKFIDGEVIGLWGPSVSYDSVTWEYSLDKSAYGRDSFKYNFGKDENKVYFSFSFPYQISDFERFSEMNKNSLEIISLGKTNKGREFKLYGFGNENAEKNIVFTCRNHACESSASYVLEGLLEYLLKAEKSEYRFFAAPFMDIDGVEDGDQGKARIPHDHNRDYTENPIHETTRMLMDYFNDKNIYIGIDLHAPWKWGERNDYPFFVQSKKTLENIKLLSGIFSEITKSDSNKIMYLPCYDIEPDTDWNLSTNSTASSYFCKKNAVLGLTIEIPYAGNDDIKYSQSKLREFGKDLGNALYEFLEKDENIKK